MCYLGNIYTYIYSSLRHNPLVENSRAPLSTVVVLERGVSSEAAELCEQPEGNKGNGIGQR